MFQPRFYRWLAIPACILAGLIELIALQKRQLRGPVLVNESDEVCHT